VTALTDRQRAFLERPFLGVVTTLRPDGSLHSTVVWVDVDDDGVSFNTAHGRAKPRYLARDPRVSLIVLDPEDPYRWLSLSGAAALVEDGAEAQIDELSRKYTGRFPYASRKPGERRVTVRIAPERIETRGIDD
jgi:PPOX class probable F420-dependent enzyme